MDEKKNSVEEQFMREILENGGSLDLDFSNDLHYEYYLSQLNKVGANFKSAPGLLNLLEAERKNPSICVGQKLDSDGSIEGPSDIAYIEVPSIFSATLKNSASSNELQSNSVDSIIAVQSTAKYRNQKSSVFIQSTVIDERNGRSLTNTGISRDCFNATNLIQMNTENIFDGNPRQYSLISTFTSTAEKLNGAPTLQAKCTVRKEVAVEGDIIESYTVIDPKPIKTHGDHVKVSYNRDTVMKDFDYSIDNEPLPSRANPVQIRFMLDVSSKLILKNGYIVNGLQKNAAPVLTLDHPAHGVVKCFYYASTKAPLVLISDDKRTVQVTLPKEPGERTAADWYSFLPFADLENTACDNLNIYGQFVFSVTDTISGNTFPFPVSFRSEKGDMEFNSQNIQNEPIYMQWGCIGKDTLITMADKERTRVKVAELETGQTVLSTDGISREILSIIKGPEGSILSITTETGKNVLLTRAHSIKANGEWIPVGALEVGMSISCENGKLEKVVKIVKEKYTDLVYNIRFAEETSLFGNGIAIGDFYMQQRIKPKKVDQKISWSDETKALICELENLDKSQKRAK